MATFLQFHVGLAWYLRLLKKNMHKNLAKYLYTSSLNMHGVSKYRYLTFYKTAAALIGSFFAVSCRSRMIILEYWLQQSLQPMTAVLKVTPPYFLPTCFRNHWLYPSTTPAIRIDIEVAYQNSKFAVFVSCSCTFGWQQSMLVLNLANDPFPRVHHLAMPGWYKTVFLYFCKVCIFGGDKFSNLAIRIFFH